jgi:hypothetical protein
VDGDDWLKHPNVLESVAALYEDPEVWLTYGSSELYRRPLKDRLLARTVRGLAAAYPDEIARSNQYRQYRFVCSHLRTYRAFLWNAIRDEDLRDVDGEYYKVAGDAASMWPMLEMASARHIRFVEDVLYVYNNDHPQSESRPELRSEFTRIAERLRAHPAYTPLRRR